MILKQLVKTNWGEKNMQDEKKKEKMDQSTLKTNATAFIYIYIHT